MNTKLSDAEIKLRRHNIAQNVQSQIERMLAVEEAEKQLKQAQISLDQARKSVAISVSNTEVAINSLITDPEKGSHYEYETSYIHKGRIYRLEHNGQVRYGRAMDITNLGND